MDSSSVCIHLKCCQIKQMELRASRALTGVGTNLKLQRGLLSVAKRIDADVHFGTAN